MKRWMTACALGLSLISCVGTKKITIRTEPRGAEVSINGVPQEGETPMEVEVSQKKDLGIVVSKTGYESTAYTVPTRTNWWLSLLWTKSDPRARFIEEDEVTIPMQRIPTLSNFRASSMPPYTGGRMAPPEPPPLRPVPKDLAP